jgi:hypothetical protein
MCALRINSIGHESGISPTAAQTIKPGFSRQVALSGKARNSFFRLPIENRTDELPTEK